MGEIRLGWGDRVRDLRKHRHRGRHGTYRSKCHPQVGDDCHNILWDGTKSTERVRSRNHFELVRAPASKSAFAMEAANMAECLRWSAAAWEAADKPAYADFLDKAASLLERAATESGTVVPTPSVSGSLLLQA